MGLDEIASFASMLNPVLFSKAQSIPIDKLQFFVLT